MSKIGEFLIAAGMAITNPASAVGETPSPTVSTSSRQAEDRSILYVPDSLKTSYAFLRDTGSNSPFSKFAPGTTIFLNPGDVKANSTDAVRDVVNAALPEGSPYREMLYNVIQRDRNIRGAVANLDVASPEAIILPGLKDKSGKQLQIVLIRPMEDYSRQGGFSSQFIGALTGIGSKYNLAREVDAVPLMAAVVLHELGHSKDEKFAIPSEHDRNLPMAALQAELVADCEVNTGARTEGVGDALDITPQTMQDYRDGRAIALLLKSADSHATAVFDLNEETCRADFNYNSLGPIRDDLQSLKDQINLRVGQHFLPNMLDAMVHGSETIPSNISPEQRRILEGYANRRSEISNFNTTLQFYKDTPLVTQILGGKMASIDPAIVYGIVKNMIENPEENAKLTPSQKRYVQNFIDACDRFYPSMQVSTGVELGHQMTPYSSETRQSTIQGYIDRLPSNSPTQSGQPLAPAR